MPAFRHYPCPARLGRTYYFPPVNSIYLRRGLKVIVPSGSSTTSSALIAAFQKNLECLGFVLGPEVAAAVGKLSIEELVPFYRETVDVLREMVGAHREFKPLYPDFPEQVMNMPEAELYLNALLHYITNSLPAHTATQRPELNEAPALRLIQLGTKEDFDAIFTRLASAKTSLSADDKTTLTWFIAQYGEDISRLLPAEIPHKENLAVLGAALLAKPAIGEPFLRRHIKTATDVLRLAVAMSGGDVSLAAPTKFAKIGRRHRRLLLELVEAAGNPTEDMLRWKGRWIRLGERLHPGEHARSFPTAAAAISVLRNNTPFATFNGNIEHSLEARDPALATELLRSRPGELCRRLDHLLRLQDKPHAVLQAFSTVAAKVSTPALLQALTHFENRDVPSDLRAFFPKGEVGRLYATNDQLPPLPSATSRMAASVCEQALLERFAQLPALGSCYLDPQMTNFLVPFSQRSASKALRTLVRGSTLPLPTGNVLRFFIWWRNGRQRTDIDLSAALYDEHCNYVDVVSYYNLKNFGGHHSGDIVDAPNGAAEFIDLDVSRTRKAGVRYVVMSINSFTMQPYCDLPECFAGWMSRQQAASGEIFEPRTVVDKLDVSSDTKVCIPAIFDLQEQRVIWADIGLKSGPNWSGPSANNVQANLHGMTLILRAMTNLRKTTLHRLFSLHIQSRGTISPTKESADTVFAPDAGITPTDLDRIAAEFL